MDTSTHVQAIAEDLRAAADEANADVVERIVRATESSLHLRLLDALGEAALDLSEALPDGHIEVRLAGRDARFVFVPDADASPTSIDDAGTAEGDGGTARLTLRMPERVKRRVEEAAAGEGVSTNAWLVDAVVRRLERRPSKRSGRRVVGYARA
jgi:hypothetical protein